jgi:hypothetical protein
MAPPLPTLEPTRRHGERYRQESRSSLGPVVMSRRALGVVRTGSATATGLWMCVAHATWGNPEPSSSRGAARAPVSAYRDRLLFECVV